MISIIANLAMVISIIGALLVATSYSMYIGFLLFTVSSFLWLYYAIETAQKQLFYTNLVFLIINIIGMGTHYNS